MVCNLSIAVLADAAVLNSIIFYLRSEASTPDVSVSELSTSCEIDWEHIARKGKINVTHRHGDVIGGSSKQQVEQMPT